MHHPTATRRQIARYDQLLAELDRAIADGDARAAGWVTTASALERTSYSTHAPHPGVALRRPSGRAPAHRPPQLLSVPVPCPRL